MPDKFLAAVIGVLPLPGAPRYAGNSKAVISRALEDLELYLEAGADVILLENSYDLPYIKPPLDPPAIALMKRIARRRGIASTARSASKCWKPPTNPRSRSPASPIWISFAWKATCSRTLAGAGLIEGCAGRLLRKRGEFGCHHIKVFADGEQKALFARAHRRP